jgi:hypothetical protein
MYNKETGMGRACSTYGKGLRILLGKPKGKKLLWSSNGRNQDNIKKNLLSEYGAKGEGVRC